MDRRSVLTLMAAAGAAGLAACAPVAPDRNGEGGPTPTTTPPEPARVDYGDDPSQWAELSRPAGTSKGVVVVIHGGFWEAEYDASLGRPLAASLAENGWTAWNLEYRRVGNGGGYPTTLDDVAAGIDALADVEDLDTSTVVTLGHSSGGHLAVWAAGRRTSDGSDPAVVVTAAVSQAGVLDLGAAAAEDLGAGAVQAFMGDGPDSRYDVADPSRQIPLDVPVRCIHGTGDTTVPLSQSAEYVERATAAGADATLTEVTGDHFVVIDPASDAWRRTLELLEELRRG